MYRLYAILGVLIFVAVMFLYVREFDTLSNTLEIGRLLGIASVIASAASAGVLYALRERFSPRKKHWPETITICITMLLFAPLLTSWLNRALGSDEYQSFEFLAEKPYSAAGYGFFMGEIVKVSGYHLQVREGSTLRRFKYKKQAYFPITVPGQNILLPMRNGIFGVRVMQLR